MIMNEGELLLAEIMKRTEEEGMLKHYPERFQTWWNKVNKEDNNGPIFLYLSDFKYQNEDVNDWRKVTFDDYIIFFKLDSYGDGVGFKFTSCQIIGSDGDDLNKKLIEPLFHGWAAFDGIRHLYLGDDDVYDNYGYLNYPNVAKLSKLLENLSILEKLHCRDPHHD